MTERPTPPPHKPAWKDLGLRKKGTPPVLWMKDDVQGWDTETSLDGKARVLACPEKAYKLQSLDDALDALTGPNGSDRRCFWWNMDFDVTALLRWDEDVLEAVTTEGVYNDGKTAIRYIPRKLLKIIRRGHTTWCYDAAQFYRSPLAKAAFVYLHRPAPEIKGDRENLFGQYTDQEIGDYCRWDARATRDLADLYVKGLWDMQLAPRHFISNGNLAQTLILQQTQVPVWSDYPEYVNRAAWSTMRGAVIDVWKRGTMDLWKYDIRSAYPAVLRDLPDFENGEWVPHVDPEAKWGFVCGRYRFANDTPPIIPTFNGTHQLYPQWEDVEAWVTLDEHRLLEKTCRKAEPVIAWTWKEDGEQGRPWRGLVDRLQVLKAEAKPDPAKYVAVKALINSLYGKTVERVKMGGGDWRTGRVFNPVAGSLTLGRARTQLMEAAMQAPSDVAILATDSIGATKPLKLDIGPELGQWDVEEEGTETLVINPGIYQVGESASYTRGFKRSAVPDLKAACRFFFKDMPLVYDRPLTSREAVVQGRLSEAGKFRPVTYTVTARNTRRLWDESVDTFHGLLEKEYRSSPVPSCMV